MKLINEGNKAEVKEKLKEVAEKEKVVKRLLFPYAAQIAGEVIAWMEKDPSIEKADTLGSLRRKAATVGDIDIAVATNKPIDAISHFVKYPKKQKSLNKGTNPPRFFCPVMFR